MILIVLWRRRERWHQESRGNSAPESWATCWVGARAQGTRLRLVDAIRLPSTETDDCVRDRCKQVRGRTHGAGLAPDVFLQGKWAWVGRTIWRDGAARKWRGGWGLCWICFGVVLFRRKIVACFCSPPSSVPPSPLPSLPPSPSKPVPARAGPRSVYQFICKAGRRALSVVTAGH